MIGIDTNILLRFLLDDEPTQGAIARQFMSERTTDDPAYVSAVVLAETSWLLNRRLGYSKSEIATVLAQLAQADEIVIEHSKELKLLTADTSRPIADIADYLVVWAAANVGCAKTFTFDRKAARKIPGMELLA
ncbi:MULTISPECIES: PIN domain-containing protein [unclassified Rhizobium]|jgi:predicted nucleic-acid-binding protein|uniref:PIN domain-containing protein n=1 Tax=unclassified Rhizobium TaxID=2613769 RepID=UPI000DD5621F|nr:PIN domain-containing protein [Rhizobium sp. UBA1881]